MEQYIPLINNQKATQYEESSPIFIMDQYIPLIAYMRLVQWNLGKLLNIHIKQQQNMTKAKTI